MRSVLANWPAKSRFLPQSKERRKIFRLYGGGCSPARTFLPLGFPVNREKYREYCALGLFVYEVNPGIGAHYRKKMAFADKSEQGNNREWNSWFPISKAALVRGPLDGLAND
jgi:hypothetical protein